ncbi:MAG: protein translocase subunit SecF, partial [Treponema sp.]|nr:protein translocase subunit SecF [Treponema sp.]
MKQIIRFSKFFLPAAIISITLAVLGISGYFIHNGFNLGVDFQAGLIQEIQFAPTALRMTYNGRGIASVSVDRTNLTIVISGVGIDEIQHDFPYSSYGTIGELVRGLSSIEGLQAEARASNNTRSSSLLQSAQNSPQLGSIPYVLHHILPNAESIQIDRVRTSLSPLGTVSVQVLGEPSERRFMIRMEDSEITSISGAPSEMIISALESTFGQGEVAVTRSDYVGSRFSKNLTDQIGVLVSLTLLLVLVYMSFRF